MNAPAVKSGDARGSGSSGGPQDYSTPRVFLDAVEARWGKIVLDCAAHDRNHVCPNWLGPGGLAPDALSSRLDGITGVPGDGLRWLNPPFAHIAPWAKWLARETAAATCVSAMLVPASVGANWYWDHVHENALTLSVGRMGFVFRDGAHEAPACFDSKGKPTPFQKDLMLCVFGVGQKAEFKRWQWRLGR